MLCVLTQERLHVPDAQLTRTGRSRPAPPRVENHRRHCQPRTQYGLWTSLVASAVCIVCIRPVRAMRALAALPPSPLDARTPL
jgi:hypothetical protein